MSLLDVLRGGVKATAAARTGFLAGEDQEQTTQRREAMQDAALKRQSRLDALAEQRAAAEEERNRAQAQYYRNRPTTTRPANPATRATRDGIMQWNATTGKWENTGMQPPEKAADRAAARQDRREAKQGTKDALAGVERQISDTRQEAKDVPTDLSLGDDEKAVTSRLEQLRAKSESLGHVRDSLVAEVKVPGSGAAVMPKKAPQAPVSATPNPADADYATAAAKYRRALTLGIDPVAAQAAYNATVALIAKRHGQVK